MAMAKVVPLRAAGLKELPKKVRKPFTDTMLVTPAIISNWKVPDFQRPIKVNHKVLDLAEALKGPLDGFIPGTITLGKFEGDIYIVDGQHRLKAFEISGLTEGIIKVDIFEFEEEADMAEEFSNLNDHLVRMSPDDKLRALEKSLHPLRVIREKCPFVGYGNVRRGGEHCPIVSMSLVIRIWTHAATDTPMRVGGAAVTDVAKALTEEDAIQLSLFLDSCFRSWGRDAEYHRLWLSLNLTLTAWIWRHMVLQQYSQKSIRLTKEQFIKCATALSADGQYLDYLVGRQLTDRDRAPAYAKIKTIFVKRLFDDGIKAQMPAPAWGHA